MIEVEVRGRLTKDERDRLCLFLKENGTYKETHEREMFLLKGYEGYSIDTTQRDVDIRLRNTNGECEIMMKKRVFSDTTGREEIALKLKDSNLETAKKIVKALGYTQGLWMYRKKEIYHYHDIEWSCVDAPKDIYYFEVEKETDDGNKIEDIKQELTREAELLGLSVFDQEQTKEFIAFLDKEVNEWVEL